MKDKIRDSADQIRKELAEANSKSQGLEGEIKLLRQRDDHQQQIIDQFQSQIVDHLPSLFAALENSKGKNGKRK